MRIIQTGDLTPTSIPSETEKLHVYNGLDCCVTLEVFHEIKPQLDNITAATYDFSKSLQGPILEMNMRGILVDEIARAETIKSFRADVDLLEESLNEILLEGLGIVLNWRSTQQLKTLFYETLQLPPVKKRNDKGQYVPTVNREALEKLETYFQAQVLVSHILSLRDIEKKIQALETEVDPDGRMRTSYNIGGTSTGRLSSSMNDMGAGGNLQNIEERLRSVYVADKGMKLAYIDLEQAESRAVGAICWNLFGQSKYLDACESGDLHTTVTKMCWPELGWTGDPKHDKELAERPFYRQHSYRHMCKVLGHGCLTEDHEVLTPDGWVSITTQPKIIMAWKERGSFFEHVLAWTNKEYTDNLISFEGNSISAIMTKDHRIPYKSDQRFKLKEKLAKNGPGTFMPLGWGYIGGTTEVFAPRLIAAFQADGHQSQYGVEFHFSKERKVERLIELCDKYEVEVKHYKNRDGTQKLTVNAQGWPKHPGAFMLDWTAFSIIEFIDELKHWDGHIGNTSVSLFSSVKEDLEWYQTLGRLVGIGGFIQKPRTSGFGSIVWTLQQNNRLYASGSSIKMKEVKNVSCQVYCPTIPSSWFYVRRNGKIYITGNSNYLGTPYTMAKHTKIEQSAVREFQTKYFSGFPELKMWHEVKAAELAGSGRLTSLMNRRRSFFGRRTDDSTVREAIAFDPQESVATILNTGMLKVWRSGIAILLLQIHDAIVVEYPEDREDEIVPQLLKLMEVPVELRNGRVLLIPSEAKTGWSWSSRTRIIDGKEVIVNPDGLIKYRGNDTRKRIRIPN